MPKHWQLSLACLANNESMHGETGLTTEPFRGTRQSVLILDMRHVHRKPDTATMLFNRGRRQFAAG